MIAAIVVPAGIRSIARMRACLVSGRIAVFEDEGASRMRDLVLFVDREVERAAALGFDLGLVMESSEVRATPSAAPPQPRRANHPAGRDPLGRLGRTQPAQQRSNQGQKPVISEQLVAGRAKILPSVSWVRIPLSPPLIRLLQYSILTLGSTTRAEAKKVAAFSDVNRDRFAPERAICDSSSLKAETGVRFP